MLKKLLPAFICISISLMTLIDAIDLTLTLPSRHGPVQTLSFYTQPILFALYFSFICLFFGYVGYIFCLFFKNDSSMEKEEKRQQELRKNAQDIKEIRLQYLKQERQNKQQYKLRKVKESKSLKQSKKRNNRV